MLLVMGRKQELCSENPIRAAPTNKPSLSTNDNDANSYRVRVSKRKEILWGSTLLALIFLIASQFVRSGKLQGYKRSSLPTKVLDIRQRFVRSNNTIVTAYYQLKTNRHGGRNDYFELMENLFSNDDPMIIFKSHDLVANLTTIRHQRQPPNRTLIIPLELQYTEIASLLPIGRWEEIGMLMNAKQGVDTHEVYWIWHAKFELLKRALDLNPFQSNFFAWYDAGMVRWDRYVNTTLIQRIPPELPDTRMMVLTVDPITTRGPHMMGGGIFGGYQPAIENFYSRYKESVQEYGNSSRIRRHKILSSEQRLMHRVCATISGLCFVVNAAKMYGSVDRVNDYFYMLPFLNQKDYAFLKRRGMVSNFTLP